ncbi:type IV pilin [Natrinema ejinorense]|uniref:Type IV pilin n=1 Tax=Natrinema ejinorense TaxID=373386 RepID=A0A2A5QPE8_9EURY|nr:type IV pilin N-terminal domain-containing protein [Natrinema ejinorense]PCR88707.1 type IV pilin [Natrinema ejinorense]
MDVKSKLVGDEEERAVSPVIGVILMVAITVILAAVIAAFVLDLGGSVGQEAQAGVTVSVDEQADEIRVEVTSLGNSDYVNITGTPRDKGNDDLYNPDWSSAEGELSRLSVGDVVTISTDSSADVQIDSSYSSVSDYESGTVSVVAVIESDETETSVASEDYDLDWSP